MSDWQERITRDTPPSIRTEHELRYRIAAPLILAGGPWVDLGCGNGLAAAAALEQDRPAEVVLVDLEQDVAARAAEELGLPRATKLALDLAEPRALERIGEVLDGLGGEPCVTCFEVIEHLSAFIPLIEWAREVSHDRGATFALSVPNDAFWSIENPHHLTAWSEGAFGELLQLLPPDRLLLRQVQLTGSVIVDWDSTPARAELAVATGGETVATHFLAAFGPRCAELRSSALAVQAEQLEQRRWERERESSIVLAERMLETLGREHRETVQAIERQQEIIVEQRETLRRNTREFDEWRSYIHELEGELGRPLSGSSAEDALA